MKRDMDLARDILLAVERSDDDPRGWIDLSIPGRSDQEVAYHVLLLAEAGLIEVEDLCTMGSSGFDFKPKRFTWHGHEFLEAARNDTIWAKAKKRLVDTTGGIMLELLKAVLVDTAREQLGLKS